ncbi:MAG: FAD-dependent oxidoreductase [Gammaproteobacteria bacterium SG8_30]|nr:MAG: FAD-dependent oxidoreductase [Gammaproteobacteria bacterium SG8_30]
MRVAVIGSGISGLTVAAGLAPRHAVTVFEASDRVGGHTHTVEVDEDGGRIAVDTGFIVFNDWTYPNFVAMLERLGVPWQLSNMSFSLQCERTGLEYNGTSLNALFAQRRNLFRPSFLHMIWEILRFNREAPAFLARHDEATSLGDWLQANRYGRTFVEHYVVPMGRAIWSADEQAMLGFPARFFVDFFHRHGFLSVNDRPQWKTVRGGSREYVRKLVAPFADRIRTSSPVVAVRRMPHEVVVRTVGGDIRHFDAVVFACHSDEALAMLEDPSETEGEILGAFPYAPNEAILHTDETLLPKSPLARAAWNYHLQRDPGRGVPVTYDMNVLQSLSTRRRYLVSLNVGERIDERKVLARFNYSHPVYTPQGVAAQKRHAEISGRRRSFYCGAYWRYGFHEDGVVSGLTALDQFSRWETDAQQPLQRVG